MQELSSQPAEASAIRVAPERYLETLLEEWRMRDVLRGEFLGNDQLQKLIDFLFPQARAWPEVLVFLFFIDDHPLLSLSRGFNAGKPLLFKKRSFDDKRGLQDAFSSNSIGLDRLQTYFLTPITVADSTAKLCCAHLQNQSSSAKPIVKLVGSPDTVRDLTGSEHVRDALTLVCTFSVQLFSKRAAERTKQVADSVKRSLSYRSKHISSDLPMEQLLDRLLQAAVALSQSEAGSVYVADGGGQTLNLVSHFGDFEPPPRFERSAPNVIPYVFGNAGLRFFLANDVHATLAHYEDDISYCPAFATIDDRPINELVFPILAFEPLKSRTIGILNLERRGQPFNKTEIVLLEQLLTHFSFELHGIRLYEPLHDTIQAYLTEVMQASHLATVEHSLRQLGHNLLEPLLHQTPCSSISVRIYDGMTTALRRTFLTTRRGRDDQQAEKVIAISKLDRSSVVYAFVHDQTVYIPSFDQEVIQGLKSDYLGLENVIHVEGRGSRCSLSVPLRVGRRVVGTVNFESPDDHVLLSYIPILENHVGLVSFLLLFAELMRVKSAFGQELELLANLHTIRSCLKDLQRGVRSRMAATEGAHQVGDSLARVLDQLNLHQQALRPEAPLTSISLDDLLRELLIAISGPEWKQSFVLNFVPTNLMVRAAHRAGITYALDSLLRNAKNASPIDWRVRIRVNAPVLGLARVAIQNYSTSEIPPDELDRYLWQPIYRSEKTCLGGFLARQHLLSVGGDLFFAGASGELYPGFTAVAEIPVGEN